MEKSIEKLVQVDLFPGHSDFTEKWLPEMQYTGMSSNRISLDNSTFLYLFFQIQMFNFSSLRVFFANSFKARYDFN